MNNMTNRTTILILSAVLIASVLSGCVQEISEIGTPDASPPTTAPEVAPPSTPVPAPPMIANWKYVSYRNLSISNAPALNQTARIAYSIIPDRDIEILLTYLSIPDGFELVDVEGTGPRTWGNTTYLDTIDAKWFPTNLSKDKTYQFSAIIKAVKMGNWTIHAYRCKKDIYISVYEDSACIRDEPFPKFPPMGGESNYTEMWSNMTRTASEPSRYNFTPRPGNVSNVEYFDLWWDGTKWVYVQNRS